MNFSDYSDPKISVSGVVLTSELLKNRSKHKGDNRGIQILLIKNKDYPYDNRWSLPTELLRDKTISDTIKDKLFSDSKGIYTEQVNVYDEVDRDPRARIIEVGSLVVGDKNNLNSLLLSSLKDTSNTEWFWVNIDSTGKVISFTNANEHINISDLALDHGKIVADTLEYVSNKILSSTMVFEFLPKQFTVRDCQEVCEWIKGKRIYSYRRYIDDKIMSSGNTASGNAHRPAELFIKKPEL